MHHYGLKCEPSPTKNAIEYEKNSSSLQAFKKSRKEKVKYIKKCKKKNCNKQSSLFNNNYSFQKRITEKTNYGTIVLAIFNHNFKRPKKPFWINLTQSKPSWMKLYVVNPLSAKARSRILIQYEFSYILTKKDVTEISKVVIHVFQITI